MQTLYSFLCIAKLYLHKVQDQQQQSNEWLAQISPSEAIIFYVAVFYFPWRMVRSLVCPPFLLSYLKSDGANRRRCHTEPKATPTILRWCSFLSLSMFNRWMRNLVLICTFKVISWHPWETNDMQVFSISSSRYRPCFGSSYLPAISSLLVEDDWITLSRRYW